jgi:hypothetical protein
MLMTRPLSCARMWLRTTCSWRIRNLTSPTRSEPASVSRLSIGSIAVLVRWIVVVPPPQRHRDFCQPMSQASNVGVVRISIGERRHPSALPAVGAERTRRARNSRCAGL